MYIYIFKSLLITIIIITCSATVTNLQQKVEQLQTTNALMKEDLAISKNQVITLQDENAQLRKLCDQLTLENKKKLEVKNYYVLKRITKLVQHMLLKSLKEFWTC